MKSKKDAKLIDVIDNLEEFLASLPWEREVNANDISHALKARIKGKVKFNLSSQDRCVKIFMCDVEKTYANKFFTVRISGSERFWSRIEGATLTKPQQKKMTRIIVGGGPVVTEPTVPVEEKVSEEQPKPVEETKKRGARKDLPIPSKEDMVKTYFLIELLKSGPIKSALVKSFSDYMGWGKIYDTVNRTLMYYGVKNTVDTSGKRIIKLSPEVKRTDEDINVLTSIIESEVEIPEIVHVFIETLELPREPETPSEKEEKEEKKEEVQPVTSKEDQVRFLKKYIYDANDVHGMFQSEIFVVINDSRLMRLFNLIKCPQDDLRGKDVRIFQKANPEQRGVIEPFFQVKEEFYERLLKEAEEHELHAVVGYVEESPAVVETVEPEPEDVEDVENENELVIEFFSNDELNTNIAFVSKRRILQFWKYGVRIKTKGDALNLVKLYYSHIGSMEFDGENDRVLETLDNIILG